MPRAGIAAYHAFPAVKGPVCLGRKGMRNQADLSEAEIAVHWQEETYYYPPDKFIAQANVTDKKIYERFGLDKFPECFHEYADLLDWYKRWDKTLDTSNPPFWRWFVGGTINASYNCVDRHLAKNKNKTAIHFVPEPESEAIQHITYQELYVRVNEFAALLRDFCGLKAGDRATLHMPMVAELPIAMLACARLCGWTLACSAPKILSARSIASCSTTSTFSQPPYQRFPG